MLLLFVRDCYGHCLILPRSLESRLLLRLNLLGHSVLLEDAETWVSCEM